LTQAPDRAPPQRVLIVKLSSLGDVVHTLPVATDMRRVWPALQVDWVVERGFAPLVRRCAAVSNVIEVDLRRWRQQILSSSTRAQWQAFRQALGQHAYDAVLDLQGLTKSALVSWLARCTPQGQRYAIANRTDGSGYEAPTRWVADACVAVTPHIHAMSRGRFVAAQALGYSYPERPDFGLGHATPEAPPCVALVHGTSRADKEWPFAHWVRLGQGLQQAGFALALPHGNDVEAQRAQALA
jgi:heptosyltransferase-1